MQFFKKKRKNFLQIFEFCSFFGFFLDRKARHFFLEKNQKKKCLLPFFFKEFSNTLLPGSEFLIFFFWILSKFQYFWLVLFLMFLIEFLNLFGLTFLSVPFFLLQFFFEEGKNEEILLRIQKKEHILEPESQNFLFQNFSFFIPLWNWKFSKRSQRVSRGKNSCEQWNWEKKVIHLFFFLKFELKFLKKENFSILKNFSFCKFLFFENTSSSYKKEMTFWKIVFIEMLLYLFTFFCFLINKFLKISKHFLWKLISLV